jgi:hypothetical protein
MHIWEDGGADRLQPAEFPALRRVVIHLKSSGRGYEFLHNGAASDIPTLEASDEETIASVRANADYEFFVKAGFETERSFTTFVQVMLRLYLSSIPTYLSTKESMVSHGLFTSAFSVFGFRLIAPALPYQSRYRHRCPLSPGRRRGRMETIGMVRMDAMMA